MSYLDNISTKYHCNTQEVATISTCVSHYSKENPLEYLFFRCWNAAKSIFGCSEWQESRKIMERHIAGSTLLLGHESSDFSDEYSKAADKILGNLVSSKSALKRTSAWVNAFLVPPDHRGLRREAERRISTFILEQDKENVLQSLNSQTLNLSNLEFRRLPNIFSLPIIADNLEVLDLSLNYFDVLPKDLLHSAKDLKQLKELNLQGNWNLKKIPNELFKLPADCQVILTNSTFPEDEKNRLQDAMEEIGYQGPSFVFKT